MFLSRGTIVDGADGVFRVVFAHDGSHVGEKLPEGWIAPPDAIPQDQESYDEMRRHYEAFRIVVTDPNIKR